MNGTSDFVDTMRAVDEAIEKLKHPADIHAEATRDFVEEMLETLEVHDLSFKQRMQVKDARVWLAKVLEVQKA